MTRGRRVPIALSGFMGAGKSTVARRVAAADGLQVTDLDDEVAASFALPCGEALRQVGEPAFRLREATLLRQALAGCDRVVALGGGTPVEPANRALLRRQAFWVHLDVPVDEIRRRLTAVPGDRPLFDLDWERRLRDRSAAYAEAHATVRGTGPVDEVVADVLRAAEGRGAVGSPARCAPERVDVPLAAGAYPVFVGRDIEEALPDVLGRAPSRRVAVVADTRVAALHGARVVAALARCGRDPLPLWIEVSEAQKEIGVVLSIVDRLLAAGWERGAPVFALGGGVLGDVAGLAAALALRGVPLIQAPTTLLAAVDASVGGKVGVNHATGKNRVGAFHQPRAVWIDLALLDTLPDRELRAGLAEVVKTALLFAPALLDAVEAAPGAALARDTSVLHRIVVACVEAKAAVVARDPHEAGERRLLNLGHTVGHALESSLGFGTLLHGEAVAIGLVAALELGVMAGVTEPALVDRVRALLAALALPVRAPPVGRDGFLAALVADKKLNNGAIPWILVRAAGLPVVRLIAVAELGPWLDRLVERDVLDLRGVRE